MVTRVNFLSWIQEFKDKTCSLYSYQRECKMSKAPANIFLVENISKHCFLFVIHFVNLLLLWENSLSLRFFFDFTHYAFNSLAFIFYLRLKTHLSSWRCSCFKYSMFVMMKVFVKYLIYSIFWNCKLIGSFRYMVLIHLCVGLGFCKWVVGYCNLRRLQNNDFNWSLHDTV